MIKKHAKLIILFIVLCITSAISIINVLDKAKIEIDNYSYYEDIGKYNFNPLSNRDAFDAEYQQRNLKISWNGLKEKTYISSFDGAVNVMPSDKYSDLCTIPERSKSVQVDISLQGTYNDYVKRDFQVHMYLITYNENGQVINSNKEIIFDSLQERSRNHTLKVKVDEKSKKYKVLLRIDPIGNNDSSGYITLSNLDVIFN